MKESYPGQIDVRILGEHEYEVLSFIRYDTGIIPIKPVDLPFMEISAAGTVTLKPGFIWDGSSGGAVDTANSYKASAFHDALYRLSRMEIIDIKQRDRMDFVYRTILKAAGMTTLRRRFQYRMLRLFGAKNARSKVV